MKPYQTERQKRGMRGVIKSFDKREHAIYDVKGKDAIMKVAKKLINDDSISTIENPNPHGIDLLSLNHKGEVVACWEVEVRHGNWRDDCPFPFHEINCIERKDHQWRKSKSFTDKIPFKLAENYQVFYVQLNKLCTRAVIIHGDTVLKYPLKPWTNRKSTGEYIRQVPIAETKQIILI